MRCHVHSKIAIYSGTPGAPKLRLQRSMSRQFRRLIFFDLLFFCCRLEGSSRAANYLEATAAPVAHTRAHTACRNGTSTLVTRTPSTPDSYEIPSTYSLRRSTVDPGSPSKGAAKDRASTNSLKDFSANAHAILRTPPGAYPLLPSVVAFIEAELSLSSQLPTRCPGFATSDSTLRAGFMRS